MFSIGVIGLVFTALMFVYSIVHIPFAEANLYSVNGKLEKGTRDLTFLGRYARRYAVEYRLDVRAETGNLVNLKVTGDQLSNNASPGVLNAETVSAKYSILGDVYTLSANGKSIFEYDSTRLRLERSHSDINLACLMLGALSLAMMFNGWLSHRKSIRDQSMNGPWS